MRQYTIWHLREGHAETAVGDWRDAIGEVMDTIYRQTYRLPTCYIWRNIGDGRDLVEICDEAETVAVIEAMG